MCAIFAVNKKSRAAIILLGAKIQIRGATRFGAKLPHVRSYVRQCNGCPPSKPTEISVRPQKSIHKALPRRNHTACGSLYRKIRSATTLSHRFKEIIHRFFLFVNSFGEKTKKFHIRVASVAIHYNLKALFKRYLFF